MAISTIGTGGDYSSPQAWEASLPATLTEVETARVLDELSSLNSIQKTFDINVTTSATNYIEIQFGTATTIAEQDFAANNGNVPAIIYDRGGTFGLVTLRNNADHIKVNNITVESTVANSNLVLDNRTTFSVDTFLEVEDVYLYCTGSGQGSIALKTGSVGHIKNTILITGVGANSLNGLTIASNFDYENLTICGNLDATALARSGIRFNTTGSTVRCYVANYGPTSGNACYLNKAPTFADNASSDTSGDAGFQNLVLLNQYTDPINHDWSFKAGNSLEGAAGGGLDIGVVISAAPVQSNIPVIMHSYRQRRV